MISKNILVIGTGAWGTALANVLIENKHNVYMYGISKRQIEDLSNGFNYQFFGDLKLLKPKYCSNNLEELLKNNIEYILLAVPSNVLPLILNQLKPLINNKIVLINSSKGLHLEGNSTFFDLIRNTLPNNKVSSIAGPSFAIDVIMKYRTGVNVISKDVDIANQVCNLFNNYRFICKPINDEFGSSITSATKNALAILCGIFNYKKMSINTISAIITLAFNEIKKLVLKFGGDINTMTEYCGIGDIYLTCTSSKSRNYKFGEMIGEHGIKKSLEMNEYTVEGYNLMKQINIILENDYDHFPFFMKFYDFISMKISFEEFIDFLFSNNSWQ